MIEQMDEQIEVILVNGKDEAIGTMGKMEAHRKGELHRAFSIFLFDKDDRLLLQQRAVGKYHSPGLWTNTCCSHPRPNEYVITAATRRLKEEMGMEAELEHRFSFIYKADVGNDLIEHELDHVFFGHVSGSIRPHPQEVQHHRYITLPELEHEMKVFPDRFTPWLHACLPTVIEDHREWSK